jgi:hypothetical protein
MTVAWSIEVNADPDTAVFVIGSSLLGAGSDFLSSDDRWVAIPTRHVLSTSVRRGGGSASRSYDAGSAVVVVDNRTGDYDPDNPDSFYTMGDIQLLTEGTGLRVKATSTGSATLFTGKIRSIDLGGHWAAPTATFTAIDLMDDLAATNVPFQLAGSTNVGDTSSDRANWLLQQAAIPPAKRSVQAGGRQLLGMTGEGTIRESLEQIAFGEAGRFYVSRTGVVTLMWHDAEYGKTTKVAWANNTGTANPDYQSIEVKTGNTGIINSATVKRESPQVFDEESGEWKDGPQLPDSGAEDSDSVSRYGRRAVTATVMLANDADVDSLATYLASRRSEPAPRMTQLVSVPLEGMTAAQAQTVLQLELGDQITLQQRTIDGRSTDFLATIENIAFDHDSPMTRATFATAPSDTSPVFAGTGWFRIGTSLLGSTDVLAPY